MSIVVSEIRAWLEKSAVTEKPWNELVGFKVVSPNTVEIHIGSATAWAELDNLKEAVVNLSDEIW